MIRLQETTIINQFETWLKAEGKSDNTVLTYQRELSKFQNWLQTYPIYLVDISQQDVQNYIAALEEQGKSSVTIDKVVGAIRTFAKFLKKPELTLNLQVISIEKKDEIEVLSTDECHRLIQQIKADGHSRNIAIVYMLLHTGIRISELCSLNKSDIDNVTNQLTVRNYTTGEERKIPLSEESRNYLSLYCNDYLVEDALFISKSRERLTERAVQYMLKKYNVNPHKLRHTFCQRLIDKGISLEIVSQLAGHKDINVTKRYAKLRIKELELEKAILSTFSDDTLG